jgi:hypothetical protein
MDCPTCGGCGVIDDGTDDQQECSQCDGMGRFELAECPRKFIGQDLTECINYASLASKGAWPVAGGILDQAAWFVALVQRLEADTSMIDTARMERM